MPLCPLECSQRTLTAMPVYFAYPTGNDTYRVSIDKRMRGLYGDDVDFGYLGNNLVKVVVYYDTLAYTLAEERALITVDMLFGTLGGHLHLFLGMSLLSVVELIELAAIASHLRGYNGRKRSDGDDDKVGEEEQNKVIAEGTV